MLTIFFAATVAATAIPQDVPGPGPRRGRTMMRADSNGDGMISRDEHLARAGKRFDRIDANRDGNLTADELARVVERRRAKRALRRGATPPVQ